MLDPGPGGREGGGVTGAVANCDWVSLRGVLLDQACEPYRQAGRIAYHLARGKLRGDPVFRAILELGLLRGYPRILDLGCGQGLLAAWLRAAAHCYERGTWPEGARGRAGAPRARAWVRGGTRRHPQRRVR